MWRGVSALSCPRQSSLVPFRVSVSTKCARSQAPSAACSCLRNTSRSNAASCDVAACPRLGVDIRGVSLALVMGLVMRWLWITWLRPRAGLILPRRRRPALRVLVVRPAAADCRVAGPRPSRSAACSSHELGRHVRHLRRVLGASDSSRCGCADNTDAPLLALR